MPRWLAICQDCWYEEFPGDYFPADWEYEDCSQCGQESTLCAHISPSRLPVIEYVAPFVPEGDIS